MLFQVIIRDDSHRITLGHFDRLIALMHLTDCLPNFAIFGLHRLPISTVYGFRVADRFAIDLEVDIYATVMKMPSCTRKLAKTR
jgi:hypothetical protein